MISALLDFSSLHEKNKHVKTIKTRIFRMVLKVRFQGKNIQL